MSVLLNKENQDILDEFKLSCEKVINEHKSELKHFAKERKEIIRQLEANSKRIRELLDFAPIPLCSASDPELEEGLF